MFFGAYCIVLSRQRFAPRAHGESTQRASDTYNSCQITSDRKDFCAGCTFGRGTRMASTSFIVTMRHSPRATWSVLSISVHTSQASSAEACMYGFGDVTQTRYLVKSIPDSPGASGSETFKAHCFLTTLWRVPTYACNKYHIMFPGLSPFSLTAQKKNQQHTCELLLAHMVPDDESKRLTCPIL